MGRQVKDWDIEVYGLETRQLERALRTVGPVNAVGKSFGVFKLNHHELGEVDVSIPRRDSNAGPGHRGIAVEGVPNMSVHEAARRRDLTINAILYDLQNDVLLDPFDGQRDLDARTLRAVDVTTFLDDPLRALRVIQFAGRLQFAVASELLDLCAKAPIEELPSERILGEFSKLFLRSEKPSYGLSIGHESGLLQRLFPEAHPYLSQGQDQVIDALVQGGTYADEAPPVRLALCLATWLANAPADALTATLDRLNIYRLQGTNLREVVLAVVKHLDDPIQTSRDLRWLSTRATVAHVLRLRSARGEDIADTRAHAAALGVLREAPPQLLHGRDLKVLPIKPGPQMGKLLAHVYAKQLDGDIETHEQALEAARVSLSNQ